MNVSINVNEAEQQGNVMQWLPTKSLNLEVYVLPVPDE